MNYLVLCALSVHLASYPSHSYIAYVVWLAHLWMYVENVLPPSFILAPSCSLIGKKSSCWPLTSITMLQVESLGLLLPGWHSAGTIFFVLARAATASHYDKYLSAFIGSRCVSCSRPTYIRMWRGAGVTCNDSSFLIPSSLMTRLCSYLHNLQTNISQTQEKINQGISSLRD